MAKFHLELDELERLALLYALGSISSSAFPGVIPLAQRIAGLANGEPAAPSRSEGEISAAAAPASSPQPARSLSPDQTDPDVSLRTFTADSITKIGDRLVVKWQDRDKILQASCWDAALFPAVLRCVKREATYLIKAVKKGNAIYLNVVGVK